MISVTELHREAMALADSAIEAAATGDHVASIEKFRRAFELEQKAAGLVSIEPTRSVLLRSAATLALDCGEQREAERLVALALSGNPPDEIADELRDLYEQIEGILTKQLIPSVLNPADIEDALAEFPEKGHPENPTD